MLKTKESIEDWLKKMKIRNYTILKNLNVDVHNSVDLDSLKLKKILIQFNIVKGSFWCDDNQFKSLEGAPREVGGHFTCSYNQLKSLEEAPQKVGRDFDCSNNRLKSLEGAPKVVEGDFNCSFNQLKSLKGAPQEVGEDFYCSYNQLESLEGAPREIGRSFWCDHNQLKTLDYVSQKFESLISDFGAFTFKEFQKYKRFRDNLKEF